LELYYIITEENYVLSNKDWGGCSMSDVSYGRSKFFLHFSFLFILINVCTSQNLYAESDWKLVKNSNGVECYTRPHKGSGIDEVKGVLTIPASVDILYAIISYAPLHNKLMHTCYYSSLVTPWEKGCQIHYFAFKVPAVWGRDIIYETCGQRNPETGDIIVTSRVVKDPSIPLKEKMVRITDSQNTWILEKLGPDKTRVTALNYTDPAGYVPQILVNIMSVDIPYYSLINMSNLAKEPIYKELAPKYHLE
jgi:hypothetical protein